MTEDELNEMNELDNIDDTSDTDEMQSLGYVAERPDDDQSESSSSDKRWYVLHTYSGHEKRVKKSLEDYIRMQSREEMFGDILVPTEEVVEMRSGQRRTMERNFYPGYVFIEMEMTPDAWHLVNSIPHVSSFIGGKEPTPISEHEAQIIKDQVQAGANNPRPRYYFQPGELIRVTDGPFEDFNGTVEDVNYEKSKLRVSVAIFGRSTPVELDFSQVTKS